jgi:hypothetical protein
VVLKDQVVGPWETRNRLSWAFNKEHKKLLEAEIHERLSKLNNRHILRYRGFRYDEENYVFRLYTEYARYGSIRDVSEMYVGHVQDKNLTSVWKVTY